MELSLSLAVGVFMAHYVKKSWRYSYFRFFDESKIGNTCNDIESGSFPKEIFDTLRVLFL